jgi:hypothetical protein
LTNEEMLNLDRELFGESNPYSFLRNCYIHVSYNSSIQAIQARMFGAVICDLLTPNLTHVIIYKTTNSECVENLKTRLRAHVVSEKWLEECFRLRMLVPETNYLL